MFFSQEMEGGHSSLLPERMVQAGGGAVLPVVPPRER